MAGEDSDREIFADLDSDGNPVTKDTAPEAYAPTEIFSPEYLEGPPQQTSPALSEDKRTLRELVISAFRGEVSVDGAGNAYVRRRINTIARREARRELRRRGNIVLGDAKGATDDLTILAHAKATSLRDRSLTLTERLAKASLEATVEGAIAARQVYIDLSRPNAVIPLAYQELKKYGRGIVRITKDYVAPFLARVVGPKLARGTAATAKWMYKYMLTPAGRAISRGYKKRISPRLKRKKILKKLEKGVGKTFSWFFYDALPYLREKAEDFYDDHISDRIGRKTKIALVLGIPVALGGIYLVSNYERSSIRPAGIIEKVTARDPATAVYRYSPTKKDRMHGINPYDIVDKFNYEYRHCQVNNEQFTWRDLRYADGRKVFSGQPDNKRIQSVRKPVYFRIEKGSCTPSR